MPLFVFLFPRGFTWASPSGTIPLCLPSFLLWAAVGDISVPASPGNTPLLERQCPCPHPEPLISSWFVVYFVRSGTIAPQAINPPEVGGDLHLPFWWQEKALPALSPTYPWESMSTSTQIKRKQGFVPGSVTASVSSTEKLLYFLHRSNCNARRQDGSKGSTTSTTAQCCTASLSKPAQNVCLHHYTSSALDSTS